MIVLQSWVAQGMVGLRAAAFALERLGTPVIALPTVVLSTHAGRATVAGRRTPPDEIRALAGALEAEGLLAGPLLTGYLGTPDLAWVARDLGRRLSPWLCDPVLGDEEPGLYLPEAVGHAYREILPEADIATPNQWELGWLTGIVLDDLPAVVEAARRLGPPEVVVTSVTAGLPAERIGLLAVTPDAAVLVETPREPVRVVGAGDLTAALLLHHRQRWPLAEAAVRTASALHAVVRATPPGADLALVAVQDALTGPARFPHRAV